MTSEYVPQLPTELKERIIQEAGSISTREEIIHLLLVSRVTYNRVSYIAYQTISVQGLPHLKAFVSLIEAKGVTFLASRIRGLFIRIRWGGTEFLPLLHQLFASVIPNLHSLKYLEAWASHADSSWIKPLRQAVLGSLSMLSNLTHLGTNSLFLEDISMVNWTSEFWSVTHLKRGSIHSTPQSHRHLLKSFPKVTHFVTKLICSPSEFFQDASALATELFYLEVLVVVYEPITRDVESFAESFPNLVIRGVNELFGDGIEARFKEIALDEGGDTWSSAEEEIERRKQSTKLQT